MTLKQIIQQLAYTGAENYAKIGTVVSVDEQNYTADIQPLDGSALISDAYLVVDMQHGGLLLQPKINALVCVVFASKEIAVVVGTAELQKVEYQVGGLSLQMTNGKIHLSNEKADFKNLLNELLTELKNAIIQTPSGVGNFAAKHTQKFEEINQKINQLFA